MKKFVTYSISYKESEMQTLAEKNPVVRDFLNEYANEGYSESDGENSVWTVEVAEGSGFEKFLELINSIATVKKT